jgi:pimeloyl-ACP methyl ester carboxylesterase
MPETTNQISLPDGRKLGYDEYGSPSGIPVFHFHGSPSSRLEWRIFGSDQLAQKLGLRVIVPDRPGMGLSDFQPGRSLLDWPGDVVVLADKLGLESFSVLGYSVGGPYAAVCAGVIPDRLRRVVLVSSLGPFDAPGVTDDINPGTLQFLNLAREKPRLNRLIMRLMGLMARYAPGRTVAQASSLLPEPDRAIMAQPHAQRAFLAMVQEALRRGPRGVQRDGALSVSKWGFHLQDIQMEVDVWHGEADRNAPISMGRYLAENIPNSRPRFYPDEGHISLFFHRIEEILAEIAEY